MFSTRKYAYRVASKAGLIWFSDSWQLITFLKSSPTTTHLNGNKIDYIRTALCSMTRKFLGHVIGQHNREYSGHEISTNPKKCGIVLEHLLYLMTMCTPGMPGAELVTAGWWVFINAASELKPAARKPLWFRPWSKISFSTWKRKKYFILAKHESKTTN